MSKYYVLRDRKPVVVDNVQEWATAFEQENRIIKKDKIDNVTVSTIFLGLDHSFGDGPPLLFETLVFGGPKDGDMERYSTIEEAEQGHTNMVEAVKATLQ